MREPVKNFLVKKTQVQFQFEYLQNCLNLQRITKILDGHSLVHIFNYFQYYGFLGVQKNCLFFRNKIAVFKFRSKIIRLIRGFLRGYCLMLEIIGLGFSVTNNKVTLRFNIGYNHSIFYYLTKSLKICTKKRVIYLFSYSYFLLKNVVTDIKNFRQLSVYKLKGIKEKNELFKKKN